PPNLSWSTTLTHALTGELSWFLWTLFVMQIILIPFARLPVWLLFGTSIAGFLCFHQAQLGTFQNIIRYLPFLLFGALIRPVLANFEVGRGWAPLLFSLLAFSLMALLLLMGWTEYGFALIICGIIGSVA